jgi:hypothetical protein
MSRMITPQMGGNLLSGAVKVVCLMLCVGLIRDVLCSRLCFVGQIDLLAFILA